MFVLLVDERGVDALSGEPALSAEIVRRNDPFSEHRQVVDRLLDQVLQVRGRVDHLDRVGKRDLGLALRPEAAKKICAPRSPSATRR